MGLSRAKFESLCESLINRCKGPCESAIKDAGLSADKIDEVVLVGGSIRIPAIQEMVKKIFGKEPHRGVNPDEVVAAGAAIQGGILAGDVHDVLLLDVTPLTLGIETLGGVMTPLIERNTTIPSEKSETFSTAADNQPAVDIHVLQGERKMASDNRSLGKFQLDGIPPAPRGVPQIEVTFKIDANGILSVSAKDKATNKEQSITIQDSTGLNEDEIKRMVREAEEHASEDEERKKIIDLRNQAEQTSYQLRKMLDENKDKLDAGDISSVESALEELDKVKGSENASEIEAALKKVEEASHAMAQKMYQQNQQAGGPEAAAGASAGAGAGATGGAAGAGDGNRGGDDVVDADFTVVDDEDKK